MRTSCLKASFSVAALVTALICTVSAQASVPLSDSANVYARYGGAFGSGSLDTSGGQVGAMVENLGDLDGDGLAEIALSGPYSDPSGSGENAGSVYVVFSQSGGIKGSLDLQLLSNFGSKKIVRIDGAATGDRFGYSIAAVSDMDSDGKKELLIGAPNADATTHTGTDAGRSYLITGQAILAASSSSTLTITTLMSSISNWGYAITGAYTGTVARDAGRFGLAVGTSGDMNGDGFPELLVADGGLNNGGGIGTVIFGQAIGSADIDLASGLNGWEIIGASGEVNEVGDAIVGIDDVGGPAGVLDGIPDLVISNPMASFSGRSQAGVVNVVYGKAGGSQIDLTTLTSSQGYRIGGSAASETLGISDLRRSGLVAKLPDINGDGVGEIGIGAIRADNNARLDSGTLYVVFPAKPRASSDGDIDLSSTPGGSGSASWSGMRIDGAQQSSALGYITTAVDMNADGTPDPLVGAPTVSHGGVVGGGEYIVYGSKTSKLVDLSATPSTWGWAINGAGNSSGPVGSASLGAAAIGIGDWNKDGANDVAIGDPRFSFDTRLNSGSLAIVTQRPIPSVHSSDPENVTESSVTLLGEIDPLNFGEVTFNFQLGKSTDYGFTTSEQVAPNQSGTITATSEITNLESCTTYHYRVVAKNDDGFTASGADTTFTTNCTTATNETPTETSPVQPVSCTSKLYATGSRVATSSIAKLSGELFRISGPKGGFIKVGDKQIFALEYTKGADKTLKSAKFSLDGSQLTVLKGLPYAIKLNTKNMAAEVGKGVKHKLTVKLTTKKGKTKTLSLSFRVGSCNPAGLKVLMRRAKGGKSSLRLTLTAGESALSGAKVYLPKELSPHLRKSQKVGTLRVTVDGEQSKFPLKTPSKIKRSTSTVKLAEKVSLKKVKGQWLIVLSGIGPSASKARLDFSSSGLFRLKKRCPTLSFKTSFSGGSDTKQTTTSAVTYKLSCTKNKKKSK